MTNKKKDGQLRKNEYSLTKSQEVLTILQKLLGELLG